MSQRAALVPWIHRARGTPTFQFVTAFLLFFAVFLAIALRGPDGGGYFPFTLQSTADDIITAFGGFGGADPASYALGARGVFQRGWFAPEEAWIINHWAPGMPLVEALFMRLFGEDVPLVLCLAVLSCALWAAAFACAVLFLRAYVPAPVALLAPFSLLALGLFRDFYLRNSLVYSEGLCTNAWALSVALMALSAQRRSTWLAVLGGLALAFSAYVRGTYAYVGVILTGYSVFMCGVLLVRHRPRGRAEAWSVLRGSPLVYALVAALAFQAFTLPFRLYNFQRRGSLGWLHPDFTWSQNWMKPEQLLALGRGWVVAGGSGMACKVDPVQCDEIERLEKATAEPYSGRGRLTTADFEARTTRTLLTRLPWWAAHKAVLFPFYWFSHPSALVQAVDSSREYVENTLYLLATLLLLVLVVRDLFLGRADILTLCAAALGATHLMVFIAVHYEVRYLFPMKFGALFIALLWLGRMASARRLPAG